MGYVGLKLKIIVEKKNTELLEELDLAWKNHETFLLIPSKFKNQADFYQNQLAYLPVEYQNHHFALLTSGSTGQPKIVVGNKKRTDLLAKALFEVQKCEEVENIILSLPLSYSFSFVNAWRLSRVCNINLADSPGTSNPKEFTESIQNTSNGMICMVGAQIGLLRNYWKNTKPTSNLKRIHFAGGRFPHSDLKMLKEIFPLAKIFNNYGCVEAMPRLCIREADLEIGPENVGFPIPGVKIRSGKDNRVEFQSPYQACGIIEGNKFHEIRLDDWTKSGDLGQINEDSSCSILGRSNEVFKRYGEKISISEIEVTLKKEIESNIAFYRDTDRNGEAGYVLVVDNSTSDWKHILKTYRSNFSRPFWPLRIEMTASIPSLPSGKIDLKTLSNIELETVWHQRI